MRALYCEQQDQREESIPDVSWCFVCGQESASDSDPCDECQDRMDLAAWAEFTHDLKSQLGDLENRIALAKEQMKRLLEKPQTAYAGSYQVSWRSYNRDQVDFKRLRFEQPDVWESYTTPKQVDAVYIDVLSK